MTAIIVDSRILVGCMQKVRPLGPRKRWHRVMHKAIKGDNQCMHCDIWCDLVNLKTI